MTQSQQCYVRMIFRIADATSDVFVVDVIFFLSFKHVSKNVRNEKGQWAEDPQTWFAKDGFVLDFGCESIDFQFVRSETQAKMLYCGVGNIMSCKSFFVSASANERGTCFSNFLETQRTSNTSNERKGTNGHSFPSYPCHYRFAQQHDSGNAIFKNSWDDIDEGSKTV